MMNQWLENGEKWIKMEKNRVTHWRNRWKIEKISTFRRFWILLKLLLVMGSQRFCCSPKVHEDYLSIKIRMFWPKIYQNATKYILKNALSFTLCIANFLRTSSHIRKYIHIDFRSILGRFLVEFTSI